MTEGNQQEDLKFMNRRRVDAKEPEKESGMIRGLNDTEFKGNIQGKECNRRMGKRNGKLSQRYEKTKSTVMII